LNKNKILVTGGAGYIGSHTVVSLLESGFEPVIVDNYCNSQPWIIAQLEQLTGTSIKSYKVDCTDKSALEEIFIKEALHGVIHFAALKAVGESVSEPLKYYQNNIGSLACIIDLMHKYEVENLVFSSSCTVYGEAEFLPVTEDHPIKMAESPYGYTKQVCEQMINDCLSSGKLKRAVTLRYFNPIGAHPSGLIGELPLGTPNNLVPFITQTAAGIRECLTVFGNDYATEDGTCVRDYIHVMDLADAHVRSLQTMEQNQQSYTLNVGTGKGSSVLEAIKAFEAVNNISLNYVIGDKREGDIEQIYAETTLSESTLNWKTKRNIEDAMRDAWKWQLYIQEKK
jgi:UDP-glucose 4-epimerase